jgi:RTX calcium-binding nonapeptide repeat (4 copies)
LGGGFYNASLTTIRSTTITDNTAPSGSGAGVASYGDANTTSTVIGSSIIAANSSTDVNYVGAPTNSFTSDNYNVIGDGNARGAFNKAGDQIIANNSPGLGPLANNGGPTQTHALLAGSPALGTILQGTKGCGTTLNQDQRGVIRPQGSACDTGSFELENEVPTVSVVAGSASNSACLAANRGRVTLKLSDANGDPLTLSATSSNTTLVPTSNITFGGTGTTRTATITTISGRTGTSNLTVTASDGQESSSVPVTVKSGGAGNNTLSGTTGADLILGQGGADTLDGLGSSDVLCGASGNDKLRGGSGADTLDGGAGTDTTPDYSAAAGDARINIP